MARSNANSARSGDTTTASASITCRGARKAVFALRDPLTRFISGFYSGLRKGAPRYDIGWSKGEKRAFSWFSTPQELDRRGPSQRRIPAQPSIQDELKLAFTT